MRFGPIAAAVREVDREPIYDTPTLDPFIDRSLGYDGFR